MSTPLYPIALDLRDKPVLVVGGGRIAARKLPELLRCGARVTVIAPDIHPSIKRLSPPVSLVERAFEAGDETQAWLVFALTSDPEANAAISGLCRGQGRLCNRADAAPEGNFQVPGVVRRGPVTLTAATGGSAPGLTRLLKHRLDALFGPELLLMAEALGELRLKERSAHPGESTRDRMERLPYNELWTAALSGAEALRLALDQAWRAGETANQGSGSVLSQNKDERPAIASAPRPVALVGAGPGHPGLITVMGADLIRNAEVILHDRLIPPELLGLAQPGCLCIPVEKRGHQPSMRQEQINNLLVAKALEGKSVVRLKGGDPFVFGRGYEEILALEEAHLPWVVVPGLSASTSVPGWAGIPLTHRGLARSFAVMTGTVYDSPHPEIPKADTLVILMALYRLPTIVEALKEQGYAAHTPALAIEKGTRSDQRICRATLATVASEAAALGFDSPALVIVGAVAGLGA